MSMFYFLIIMVVFCVLMSSFLEKLVVHFRGATNVLPTYLATHNPNLTLHQVFEYLIAVLTIVWVYFGRFQTFLDWCKNARFGPWLLQSVLSVASPNSSLCGIHPWALSNFNLLRKFIHDGTHDQPGGSSGIGLKSFPWKNKTKRAQ